MRKHYLLAAVALVTFAGCDDPITPEPDPKPTFQIGTYALTSIEGVHFAFRTPIESHGGKLTLSADSFQLSAARRVAPGGPVTTLNLTGTYVVDAQQGGAARLVFRPHLSGPDTASLSEGGRLAYRIGDHVYNWQRQ